MQVSVLSPRSSFVRSCGTTRAVEFRGAASGRRLGPFEVSPMGLGTWSWGNRFLWGYTEKMDPELQEVFNYSVSQGINLFDTADSYGKSGSIGTSVILDVRNRSVEWQK